jgi:hypothetical protein
MKKNVLVILGMALFPACAWATDGQILIKGRNGVMTNTPRR